MTQWLLATAAWDVYLAKTGRQTLSQEMRRHPLATGLAALVMVVHLYEGRDR